MHLFLSYISKLLIALIINSYFERSNKINEPLIPGRIVAVIAIEPDKNTKIGVSGVEAGERNEISPAITTPKNRSLFAVCSKSHLVCILTCIQLELG